MSGVAEALKSEFPEATHAECVRFAKACQDGKKDADQAKEEAEHLLENYLDWRSCYGLDYKKTGDDAVDDDAADWKYAIEKALEVEASMRKAKELEKKLAEEANKEEEKFVANYDIEMSDSQKEEGDKSNQGEDENGEDSKEENKESSKEDSKETEAGEKDADGPDPSKLQQMVYLHKKDGKKITDKKGNTILHVLPGMINRKEATGDTYGLALCFYLDRKFDRASEEKMTVLIDVRAGEGWPNPVAVMMVRFVRKVVLTLQAQYPERLDTLHLYPVPRMAMSIFGAVKRAFKYGIMDKVVLYAGPADRYSPLPKELLEEYVDGSVLDFLEEFRIDHFRPTIGTLEDK
jgi:hypothetical protein